MTDPDKVRELIDQRGTWSSHEQIEVAWACAALLQRVTELEASRDALQGLNEEKRRVIAEQMEKRREAEQHNAALREALRAAQKMRDLMRLDGPRAQVVTPMDIATGHFDAAVHRLAPYLSEGEKE